MKKLTLFSFALLLIGFTVNCNSSEQPEASADAVEAEATTAYNDMTQEEFKAWESELPEDVVILDVRTDPEVANGTIEGAIQIDFRADNFREEVAKLDTSKTYVVYCQRGGRSAAASEIMSEELGFDNVNNLLGGYSEYSTEESEN